MEEEDKEEGDGEGRIRARAEGTSAWHVHQALGGHPLGTGHRHTWTDQHVDDVWRGSGGVVWRRSIVSWRKQAVYLAFFLRFIADKGESFADAKCLQQDMCLSCINE